MSAPLSLIFHVPVSAQRFAAALDMPLEGCAKYGDWAQLGVDFSDEEIADADAFAEKGLRDYLDDLREGAREELGWYFVADAKTGYVTCFCLLWSELWPEMLAGLNLLRQAFTAASDGRPGYILVHDFAFQSRGTVAAILMREGVSEVSPINATGVQKAVQHAQPIAQHVMDTARSTFDNEATIPDAASVLVDQYTQTAVEG